MRKTPESAQPFLAAASDESLMPDDLDARAGKRQAFANAFQQIIRGFLLPSGLFFGTQVILHALF